MKDAHTSVSRKESHRGVSENSHVTEARGNATNIVNRGANPNLICRNCGKIGHTIDRCFKLLGFPSNFKIFPNNSGKQNYNANNADVKNNKK